MSESFKLGDLVWYVLKLEAFPMCLCCSIKSSEDNTYHLFVSGPR